MKLTVSKNNDVENQVDLEKEVSGLGNDAEASFFIGRSEDCHVHLPDKQVSREHAILHFANGKWRVQKKASMGELFVNGAPASDHELSNGDVIRVGPFQLNVSLGQSAPIGQQDETSSVQPEDGEAAPTETYQMPQEEEAQELGGDNQNHSPDEGQEKGGPAGDDFAASKSDGLDNDENDGEGLGEFDEFQPSGSDEDDQVEEDLNFQDDEDQGGDLIGGDDDFGMDNDAGEGTQVVQSFAKFELEIFGEHAPFDKYLIDKNEVHIGRDPEKSDIILKDPEVSARHAVIRKNNITCSIEDLNSANGTLLNGARVNKSSLTNEDEFIIGSTTFTVKVGSDLLSQEEDKLMPVDNNQEVEVEEVVEVGADFDDGEGEVAVSEGGEGEEVSFSPEQGEGKSKNTSLFSKEALQDPERRKKILIISVVLLGLWVLLGEEESGTQEQSASKSKENKENRVLNENEKEQNEKEGSNKKQKKLSQEQKEYVESVYQVAKNLFDQGKYSETIFELEKIFKITEDYKRARQINQLAKQGLAKIEEMERKRQKEIERKKRQKRVKELVKKAKKAVENRKAKLAKSYFDKILELDPSNYEVPQLKVELEAWQEEQERKALKKAQEKAERQRQVKALKPGKTHYLKKEWYKATIRLEEFLKMDEIDEDLMKEATKMLKESKKNLNDVVDPLLGKARSLREGQDLKGAYETYKEVLEHHPSNAEALNEMNEIREKLMTRSRKVYREALIAESLSLFDEAKDKFQEVQQISPKDSQYYEKASERLKEYLE